jgi:hypothetical protein
MAYEMKDGNFSLFKNNRKEKETHPDYAGSIMINGKEHYLNAWLKDGKNGKFFSGSVGKEKAPKDNFIPKGRDEMPKNTIVDDDLGDVPF